MELPVPPITFEDLEANIQGHREHKEQESVIESRSAHAVKTKKLERQDAKMMKVDR